MAGKTKFSGIGVGRIQHRGVPQGDAAPPQQRQGRLPQVLPGGELRRGHDARRSSTSRPRHRDDGHDRREDAEHLGTQQVAVPGDLPGRHSSGTGVHAVLRHARRGRGDDRGTGLTMPAMDFTTRWTPTRLRCATPTRVRPSPRARSSPGVRSRSRSRRRRVV
jgi:hypothetical protein